MPSIEKHVEISKQRTNREYREIHEWIDDPPHKDERHDWENIQRQFEVYDALYAGCRLDLARKPT